MMNRAFPRFGFNPVTGDWNDSLVGQFAWSNVNVAEAVPDVMTPSTWSLWWIFHVETNPFHFPGRHPICGNICGRPYLNISLMYSVYRALGRDARKELERGMTASMPVDVDIPAIPISKQDVVRVLAPAVLKAHIQAARDRRSMPLFLRLMPNWYRKTRSDIQQCPDAAHLSLLWHSTLRPTVVRACRMLRSVTMLVSEPSTVLHTKLAALVGETETNALMSNVSNASSSLESLGPLLGMARLRDGLITRAEYLERYGHRGPHEMELAAPGLDEDPVSLDAALAAASISIADVQAMRARQEEEHAWAWQCFQARYPRKAASMRRALDGLAQAVRDREAVRSEVTRLARLVRFLLLRAGELTGLRSDIFFLSLDEIAELLTGRLPATQPIPARREKYCQYASLPPYPAMIVGSFDPVQWSVDPNRRSDLYDARYTPVAAPSSVVKGFAGAAGCVDGIVRRIDCPEDGGQLQPGEILVTVTTNVGWTPLFPRLAAIVTDVGAPLSHAAIVAREMGIPAVVGCGNATMLLRTGDGVRVDGERGTVEILYRS